MPDTDTHTTDATSPAHRLAPAAPDEDRVYGACCPGWHTAADQRPALDDWIEHVRGREIERVCSLLACRSDCDGVVTRYREAFGPERVLHAPLPDERLADGPTLREDVLPFLDAATDAGESVVVHCLTGLGRTGQVLAAWLVHDRGLTPERAIGTVESMGRLPDGPVRAGHATEDELHALLESVR